MDISHYIRHFISYIHSVFFRSGLNGCDMTLKAELSLGT